VAFSSALGFLAAGADAIPLIPFVAAVSGTTLASASANTFNQIAEVQSDKIMRRTRMRPLPTERLTIQQAKRFAWTAGIVGTGILAVGTNPMTAVLGASNIYLYARVYTQMKKTSCWNTAIGAVVGALPPVMGWTAATGILLSAEPLVLFTFQFLWQIPHFLALAYRYREDYTAGGYRMLSVDSVDPSGRLCAIYSLLGSLAMLPIPFLTSQIGMTSYMFALDGSIVNAWLVWEAVRFFRNTNDSNAIKLFKTSLINLAILLGLFAFHHKSKVERVSNVTEEENATIPLPFEQLQQIGSALCMHELVAHRTLVSELCPKTSESSEIHVHPTSSTDNINIPVQQ
jgi:protoheme IX farnesyltransferase